MAILRDEIKNNFSIIPNEIIKRIDLPGQEYKLIIYLFSLPNEWKIDQTNLADVFNISRENMNKLIARIKTKGFLEIQKKDSKLVYLLKIPVSKTDTVGMCQKLTHVSKTDTLNNTKTKVSTYINNTKNINNKLLIQKNFFENEELNDLFNEFLKMRKRLKVENSERAINMLLTKLEPFNDEIKKQMIEESILNSWKSVFPLKSNLSKRELEKQERDRKIKEFIESDD